MLLELTPVPIHQSNRALLGRIALNIAIRLQLLRDLVIKGDLYTKSKEKRCFLKIL